MFSKHTAHYQIVILCFTILVSLGQQTLASSECLTFYASAPIEKRPIDIFELWNNLFEPKDQPALGEVVSSPEPKLEFTSGHTITRSNSVPIVPLALKNILPKPWSNKFNNSSAVHIEAFYRNLYGRYGDTFNNKLILDILETNKSIEYSNTTYGEVRDTFGVVGTWRWFEANTIDQSGPPYDLPYVRMNKVRKVQELKVTEKLKSFMNLGFGVTEIGAFSVKSSDAKIRERATHIIDDSR